MNYAVVETRDGNNIIHMIQPSGVYIMTMSKNANFLERTTFPKYHYGDSESQQNNEFQLNAVIIISCNLNHQS
jgi:hypothetical protein